MTDFVLSDHATVRMAQRSISLPDAELITLIGTEVSDGYLVRAHDYQQIETQVKRFLGRVQRLQGKRLVVAEGRIVTAYRASRRKSAGSCELHKSVISGSKNSTRRTT
jgi:hypothetical protein